MREFWDERADENALFFVDNTLDYRAPDADRFWQQGQSELDMLLDGVDAALAPEDDVVEIGCGVGRLTHVIASRARTVRALDVSPRMLENARRFGRDLHNVEWLLGDGESLTAVADCSADVCLSHVVFQHIPDPRVTLGYVTEIGRVLKPGGWAAFQVSNDPGLHPPRTGTEGFLIAVRGVFGRGPRGQADPRWLGAAVELDDLREAADRGHMDVERVTGEGKQLCFVRVRRRP
jgi:SAM-dependent methyltransferase